jgi:D-alanyl-lipoteichoic acid acyltransferase DltB (MBOAT superfamily)
MSLTSLLYVLFLLISVSGFYGFGNNYKIYWLLFLNYVFYSLFGAGFACLLIITTIVTFYTALNTFKAESKKQKQFYFYLGIVIDLTVYVLFKYLHIIDIQIMTWPHVFEYSLLIPVGISFYTFKTVGYCIDVYKSKIRPETSLIDYACSISFFPHIISGPITSADSIGDQLKKQSVFDISLIIEGAKLILWGFFKKIVIADSIAEKISPAFNDIYQYQGPGIFILFFLYTYQLYIDFSGYSDIAIGSAKCLGIDLTFNFNKPFFAGSFKRFWGRWHTSLSKWMRDYIYIPLGGSRKGTLITCINLSVVFLITGIWHGFAPNYFLFALFTLSVVLIEFLWVEKHLLSVPASPVLRHVKKVFNYFYVVFVFTFSLIFFRTQDLSELSHSLNTLFFDDFKWQYKTFVFSFYLIMFFELLQYFQSDPKTAPFGRVRNFYIRMAFYLLQLFLVLIFANKSLTVFEYFQF